jgi:hypothetical protein
MKAEEFTRKALPKSKIYLDLDGVLANFFAEYAKLANVETYRDIPAAKVDPILNSLIGTDFFARLPKFPTTDQLIKLAIKHAGSYHICSSPLRKDYNNSAYWKKIWIRAYLKPQPATIEITPEKAQHAMTGDVPNILIDDKGSNIRAWVAAGGIGIKYQADEDPLSMVADALESIYCDVEKTCNTVALKEDEFDKCYDYAEQLYTRAKQKGLDAELIQVAGYQGDDTLADERWKEIPKKYWKHYVVKMGTTVLDPSASQFNPDAETKYPERTLNKMWDEQYVIKEMSYRDATKILKKHHYHLDRQQGRHEVWKDEEGHSFALPHKHHGKDLSKGIMHALNKEVTHENFADGKVKGKSRPGRVKKAGASCKGSVTDLRAKAKKASGEKAKMYHWCANMKSGKKK